MKTKMVTFVLSGMSLLITPLFAVEPNDLQGACYTTLGTIETGGASPAWITVLDRNSTDTYTTERLIVQLDSSKVFGEYEVFTMEQGSPTGVLAHLEPDDIFVEWDEDPGDGSRHDFIFSGVAVLQEPNEPDYVRVFSTNDNIINWTVYRVIEAGTLTITGTGYNEHDAFRLHLNLMDFHKYDGLEDTPGACVSPGDEITYTICWYNDFIQTLQNPYIIDYLPEGVDYPAGFDQIVLGDPNDPNDPLFTVIPADLGYDKETHTYIWPLSDLDPNTGNCVSLDVVVNSKAVPGGILHNVAELCGTYYDPNGLPVTGVVARAIKDTDVCCYAGITEILYVDNSATDGADTGLNWQNAFLDLQDALDYARHSSCAQVHSIYVAQETYFPGDAETDTFDLQELPGIALYGGFPSGGCDFSLRNPKRYQTILSGKIDETHRNNAVITMGNNTLLDGFTVTEGASAFLKGSIYGSGVDFVVANSRIERNEGVGAYIENGNAEFRWCHFTNNKGDGIRHTGEAKSLFLENVWVRQSGQYGVYCLNSTPIVINSILSESDMSLDGRSGLMMVNPPQRPYLQNVTVAHNKTRGIWRAGGALPEIFNSIVYHNGDEALVGFSADDAAMYSCIEDANSINGNINVDPQFAYFDPNNVRLDPESDCRHASAPLNVLDYSDQVDMDGNPRISIVNTPPDMGAYEMVCDINVSSDWDLNADGLVNFDEFSRISRVWMAHDPNDPAIIDPNHPDHEYYTDPNSSGFVTASSIAKWYPDGIKYNYSTSGYSQYAIDLADLLYWAEEAPWVWKACWVDLEEMAVQQMTSGGDMILMGEELLFSTTAMPSEPLVEEKSVQEQMLELASAIMFLERIWLEEPDLQQEINAEDWQEFMDAVYQNLFDLQTTSVQLE